MLGDIGDALRLKLSHDDLSVYNHVQKLLYIGVLTLGVLVVLSGLAIWKPVQLWWLTDLFYGFQGARWVHFFCMPASCCSSSCTSRWRSSCRARSCR